MSYSELYTYSKMPELLFNENLQQLTQSALVHQYYKEKAGSQTHSFYEVSVSGRRLIEKLLESASV